MWTTHLTTSLDRARTAYDAMSMETKLAAGLEHAQHEGRQVLPLLESTTLREVHGAVPEGEVVVLATVIGDQVEFGMFTGSADTSEASLDASLDMTMRQLIDLTMQQGQPGPPPGDPLHTPYA